MCDTQRYLVTLADLKHPETSWVNITTITIISKFSQDFDIQKLRKRLQLLETIQLKHEWVLKPTSFYNQVSLGYTDAYSTKSVKVFPNGSVQVAGCCDLFDCKRVLQQLTFILKTVLELKSLTLVNGFRVVMINTNFSLNYSINLMETARLFAADKAFTSVTFDPDRYSAVKVKFKPGEDMKQVTVSMFSTGKIIVTGAETLREIVFAYHAITHHVETHAAKIKVKPSHVPDTFHIVNGYPVEEIVAHLRSKGIEPWRKKS
jgi:hypothetical protein